MARGYKTYKRTRINFDDDFVIIYDEHGNQIYKGIEDYSPMKDENWVWDNKEQAYIFGDYIKICVEV